MSESNKKKVSVILKFILATNYYYTIVDELKESHLYSKNLKFHLNQMVKEMDKVQKTDTISKFFDMAEPDLLQNNYELHTLFFETLSKKSSSEVEAFMIDFIEKNKKDE
mgnify:FL=1